MSYYLGVDVGGSHVAAALVTKGRLLGEVSSTANTANTEDALIDLIIALVIPLLEGVQLQGVGLGVPGQVKAGRLVAASNLLYLREADLAGRVSAELGVPTMLFNDANCAVAAELLGADSRDAYLNSPTAALLTLGTGVGLGLFVQGRLHEGASGLVEGGHSIIAMGGRLCGCGQRGCAEAYASARSVVARYEEAGGHAVDAQEVFKRASQGDAAAVVVVEEVNSRRFFRLRPLLPLLLPLICACVDRTSSGGALHQHQSPVGP
jgi:glucokinase